MISVFRKVHASYQELSATFGITGKRMQFRSTHARSLTNVFNHPPCPTSRKPVRKKYSTVHFFLNEGLPGVVFAAAEAYMNNNCPLFLPCPKPRTFHIKKGTMLTNVFQQLLTTLSYLLEMFCFYPKSSQCFV